MFKLIVQRLLALVPLLFIVSVLTFSFTSLLPSDPVDLIIGDLGTQEQYDMVRERLGLNEPVVLRYVEWLGRAVQGDLGTSFFNSVSVTGAVMQRLPVTLSLTVVSALIAVVVGVGAGIAAALRPRSWIDRLATLGATIGQAIPNFWFGIIMVAVFAVNHALTNAMVPVVAVLSFQITVLLGGALIVEQVFAINGLGTLAITAVRRQDIPMIQGLVLVMVALVVIVQLATDVVYGLLNPKARPS